MTPDERAATLRLGELITTSIALRPALDDLTRARVAARLRRGFEAMVDRSERGGPLWICWDLPEPYETSHRAAYDESPYLGEAYGAATDGAARWEAANGQGAQARRRAEPMLQRPRRVSLTRLLVLASIAAAAVLGAVLRDRLRQPIDGEPAPVSNPIVTTLSAPPMAAEPAPQLAGSDAAELARCKRWFIGLDVSSPADRPAAGGGSQATATATALPPACAARAAAR